MSPFKQAAQKLGLTSEAGTSQDHHFMYLLLTALGDQDEVLGPASVTFVNKPATEVLHRLQGYKGHAIQSLQRALNSQVVAEARA